MGTVKGPWAADGTELVRPDFRALWDQLIAVVMPCGIEGQRRYVEDARLRDAVH